MAKEANFVFLAIFSGDRPFSRVPGLVFPVTVPGRTRGGVFRYRISLRYTRSLFFAPRASENASRTPGACFLHGAHIPYRRRPSPAPNATQHPQHTLPGTNSTPNSKHPNTKRKKSRLNVTSIGTSEKRQLPTLPPGGAVPSALVSLTSLFGMGRGGSSPL